MGLEEGDQRRRAGFLFALQQDGQAAGQLAMHGLPRPQSLKERHQLALVIRGTAGADHAAFGGFLQCGIKRITFPKIKRINRLHVVVAIEQQMRATFNRLGPPPSDGRAWHGPGVKSQRLQIRDQPIGGGSTIRFEGRIGGNRGDVCSRANSRSSAAGWSASIRARNDIKGHAKLLWVGCETVTRCTFCPLDRH